MDQEQAYLNQVMSFLKKQESIWKERIDEDKQKVVEIRQEMFEDNTKSIATWDDVYELNAMDALVAKYGHEYGVDYENWRQLQHELDSPYFGRIDFVMDGDEEEDVIYIGTYAVKDTKTFRYYVYDWRSPIASMYYDYEPGEAEYEAPMGKIHGEITRKRQYKIAHGQMQYWFDTDDNIEDELLAQTLSENTDGHLKVIVSSIQKEQNQVVRKKDCDTLCVFGPAGSGKTSVGMHRLAYLLYHNRGKLNANQIMIVANNEIFSSYIANILPDLGEERPQMAVFYDYMKQYLPEQYVISDFYEMMEHRMNGDSMISSRSEQIRIKSSLKFLQFIIKFMSSQAIQPIPLLYEDVIVAEKESMERYIRKDFAEENIKVTLEQTADYIEQSYEAYFNEHKIDVQELYYQKTSEYIMEDELEVFLHKEKNRSIHEAMEQFVAVNGLDPVRLYLQVLEEYLEQERENRKYLEETKSSFMNNEVPFEDGVGLLCVLLLMGRITPDHQIKQVLVDEAQDYNVLQMYFLRMLYPNSRFTILADANQAVGVEGVDTQMNWIADIFGQKTQICKLTKSYRSTAPINELANHLLDDSQKIEYVGRSGQKPAFIHTADLVCTIKRLVQEESKEKHTVGILVYHEQQADDLYTCLKDEMKVQLIRSAQDDLEEQIVILPLLFAKGLEFDCVIGAGDFLPENEIWKNPNVMYLLCTRALHRLYLLSTYEFPQEMKKVQQYLTLVEE